MSESDFSAFLARARERVRTSCRLGGFARDADQTDADLYGTAAAVGVRIALGDAPRGAEASEIVRGLLAFRRADGLFIDETHGPVHRAATAVTTIRALGGEPEPPPALRHELEASRVPAFLDGLSWENPWLASHDAAGMLAIALICRSDDEASREAWRDAYVTWLDDHADGQTGLWPANGMGRLHDEPGLFGNLGCSP